MSGHLADLWGDLVEKERALDLEKKRLKTMILATGQNKIAGNTYTLHVSTIVSDRFDSTAFAKAQPATAAQWRKKVSSIRIDLA